MMSTSLCVTGLDRAGLVISQRKLSSTAPSSIISIYVSINPPSLPAVSEKHIIVDIEKFPVVLHIARVTKVVNIIAKVIPGRLTVGLVLH